ncbi:hypothetical protein [Streptosporangium sp. NPDC001681]|uniref:hypothetical protein n=1 Tax=Streptosporangium sp. NPDC001681 TaxID=3154395 RepID=UPI0033222E4C
MAKLDRAALPLVAEHAPRSHARRHDPARRRLPQFQLPAESVLDEFVVQHQTVFPDSFITLPIVPR